MAENFRAKLEAVYGHLSKGHRRIADFIKENYERASFMTAAALGETVGVSESTVVRFAGALGFDGYPDLQSKIRDSYHRKLYAFVNSAAMNGITADTAAANAQPVWVTILEILMGAGYVGFMVLIVLYVLAERKERRA